jgi:hypothetical protein
MDFQLSDRQQYWQGRVREFIDAHCRPAIATYHEQDKSGDRWKVIPVVEELKAKAKAWQKANPDKVRGYYLARKARLSTHA